jgi:iron-sulfur cluster assembly accessory protein
MATTKIVEVSDLAAEKFRDLLKEQGEKDGMLRVMVAPGGNGGMQYMLSVEQEASEDDIVIEADRIRVLVDPDSAPLIEGSQIDYSEGLMRSGFIISNPNFQTGGCGCGGGGACGCGGGGGGCGCGGGGGGCGGGGGGCGCGGGGGGCGCGGGGGGCGCGGGGCGCGGH